MDYGCSIVVYNLYTGTRKNIFFICGAIPIRLFALIVGFCRRDSQGMSTGLGEEDGVRGTGKAVYFNDPNSHRLEIRAYDVWSSVSKSLQAFYRDTLRL